VLSIVWAAFGLLDGVLCGMDGRSGDACHRIGALMISACLEEGLHHGNRLGTAASA
jgi:hypothetical protein